MVHFWHDIDTTIFVAGLPQEYIVNGAAESSFSCYCEKLLRERNQHSVAKNVAGQALTWIYKAQTGFLYRPG
jgi:hypothetical protein